jgi:hypothetical protein
MDPTTLADVRGIYFMVQAVDEGGLPTLPNAQQGVPMDQAIGVAMAVTPAGVDQANILLANVQVSAQYTLFSNDRYGQTVGPGRQIRPYVQNRPAWVITFSGPGVAFYGSGPRIDRGHARPSQMQMPSTR